MTSVQPEPVAPLVEHFFRREAGRLVAVLTRFFGWRNFDLVEEMVQSTLVDAGDALTEEGKVVHGNKVVTDGPFVESKEIVGGFSIVNAETIAAAAELANGCPALLDGGKVEVRPLAGIA